VDNIISDNESTSTVNENRFSICDKEIDWLSSQKKGSLATPDPSCALTYDSDAISEFGRLLIEWTHVHCNVVPDANPKRRGAEG
jgi:hypothetical protein